MVNKEKNLIVRIKEGDENAFNSLYKMHWESLLSYAELIAGKDFAKDIVNDVFYNVWTNRVRLRETGSLKPYLMRSIYNKSLNFLRTHSKLDSLDSQIEEISTRNLDPDNNEIIQKLYNDDTRSIIIEAMHDLPPKCYDIFYKSYIENLPHKKIASILSISLSTVDNQVYKALKILRHSLLKK